jgi:methionyl-tRNA synthetase
MKKNFYITTTLPYVNAKPHLGFAVEIIRADAIARYQRNIGKNVFFNTGTDEHGVKIFQKAQEEGITPQELCDRNSQFFRDLKDSLNISYDAFIRTTDKSHEKAAQEFWKKCRDAGYIEKRTYTGLYCKGCEMFKTGRDLVDGKCVDHPNMVLEEISEENYFFLYSKFSQTLLDLYEQKDFVIPEFRLNEIKNQIKEGLEDFSISRIKSKMPWGISVPDDDEQVMYVWFDALVNYISTLGWPFDMEKFGQFWNSDDSTVVQICGKDNLQHQAARWQAMLASVNLPLSTHIIVNGFITVDGQKMSKSLGNVIDPVEIVNEYGIDALRYFAIRELSPHEDGDFNIDRFKEAYNANLANGIGNLTNRILKMFEDLPDDGEWIPPRTEMSQNFIDAMNVFDLHEASRIVWQEISDLDKYIQQTEPFKLVKVDPAKGKEIILSLVDRLNQIAHMLEPLLPDTAQKIITAIDEGKKPETPIFNRI